MLFTEILRIIISRYKNTDFVTDQPTDVLNEISSILLINVWQPSYSRDCLKVRFWLACWVEMRSIILVQVWVLIHYKLVFCSFIGLIHIGMNLSQVQTCFWQTVSRTIYCIFVHMICLWEKEWIRFELLVTLGLYWTGRNEDYICPTSGKWLRDDHNLSITRSLYGLYAHKRMDNNSVCCKWL
jgi:hypothetical protein